MRRLLNLMLAGLCLPGTILAAEDLGDPIMKLPSMAGETVLYDAEVKFGYRGKVGVYQMPPSRIGVFLDEFNNYQSADSQSERTALPEYHPVMVKPLDQPGRAGTASNEVPLPSADEEATSGSLVREGKEIARPEESICVVYDFQPGKTFCGAYVILLGDITGYQTLSFMIKGEKGGETFELGMNDAISNKREDAVVIGSLHSYLPDGVTTNWQRVLIPIEDFYGPDLSRVYSLVFMFNEVSAGKFWVDEFRFHKQALVDRKGEIYDKGYLLLDNFDHTDVNLLGRKCGTYKKLPSVCLKTRDEQIRYGDQGRSLKLEYHTKSTGWCGYYTLLNQIDGLYYDLTSFESVSFMVRGGQGGEMFELGLADRNWVNIGDSLKAGTIDKFLPEGVTTNWQEVTIPLEEFGLLDFSEMGSFVINFLQKGDGVVYLDDLKFHLKKDALAERRAMQEAMKNQGDVLLVDGFEFGRNLLQGRSGCYKMAPSSANSSRDKEVVHGGAQSLKIVYDKQGEGGPGNKGGWCGYWTNLKSDDNKYYDATAYKKMVLWVRGEKGGENFRIGLADKFWDLKEDSIKAKDIVRYLPEGKITTEWQKAEIPFSEWNIDFKELASLVVAFEGDCFPPTGAQAGAVYLDDLTMEK